jgi:hypothetical protein
VEVSLLSEKAAVQVTDNFRAMLGLPYEKKWAKEVGGKVAKSAGSVSQRRAHSSNTTQLLGMQQHHKFAVENHGEALSWEGFCRMFCGMTTETRWPSRSTRWRFVWSKAEAALRWVI